jgi:transposase
MQAIIERCCGLDVHQETVVAYFLISARGARPIKEVRTFGPVTRDLEELRDWLWGRESAQVAIESTVVYWCRSTPSSKGVSS